MAETILKYFNFLHFLTQLIIFALIQDIYKLEAS